MLIFGERKLAAILISFMLFFRLCYEKPWGDFSKKAIPGLAYYRKCDEWFEIYISPLVVLFCDPGLNYEVKISLILFAGLAFE